MKTLFKRRAPLSVLSALALLVVSTLITTPAPVYAAGTDITLSDINITNVDCNWQLELTLDITVDIPNPGDLVTIDWTITVPGMLPNTVSGIYVDDGPGPTTLTHDDHYLSSTTGFALPAGSLITYTFTDQYSDAEAGLSVNCTTGAVTSVWSIPDPGPPAAPAAPAAPVLPAPGPDMVSLPATAVVGSFTQTTAGYHKPDFAATTEIVMEEGKTVWVYGVDVSGAFYKVLLSGVFFWVPVDTMGPNFDAVWNGTPLPTGIVE
jgi:hypothetical protein